MPDEHPLFATAMLILFANCLEPSASLDEGL